MKKLLFIVVMIFVLKRTEALTVRSLSHSPWSNPATWSNGQVPTTPDTIIVEHYVTINADLTINSPTVLKIESTGTLCGDYLLNISCGSVWLNYGSVFVNRFIVRNGANYCTITTHGTSTVTGCPSGSWSVVPPKGNMNIVAWSACNAVDTNWDIIAPVPVVGGCTVGIKEEFLESAIAFPNPVNDKFKIRLTQTIQGKVALKDISGRVVKLEEESSFSEKEIDFTDLVSGIYFAEIKTVNNTFIKKIIKN